MAGERILVVDDNAVNAKLARIVLEDADYEVETALNGPATLAAVASFRPHLVLMDLWMPDVSGLELTQILRADPANAGLVIVLLTASAPDGGEGAAREAGCDGYMTKPIRVATFADQIAAFLAT